MTTTKLEIANGRLHAAVHHVFDRLPSSAKARLARANLVRITDAPYRFPGMKIAVCARYADGSQEIYLSPGLARLTDEEVLNIIAHEFAHALQPAFLGGGFDEHYAKAQAEAWGFEPTRYPVTHWRT
jgi:Zn-dependent protease with chaperone function